MSATILVIEDDEVWQHKIKIMLAPLGLTVVMVTTLEEGKKKLESTGVDLIISDVVLPDGESIAFFNGFKRSCPIVFATNYPKEFYLQQSLSLTGAHFLVKPFHEFTLHGMVKRLLPVAASREEVIPLEKGIYVWGKYKQKILIPFTRVIFIKSDRNYTEIFTKERTFTQKVALGKLKDELAEFFVQVHRCFVVNVHFVQRVDLTNKKILANGEYLPLGRSYQKMFIKKLTELKGE